MTVSRAQFINEVIGCVGDPVRHAGRTHVSGLDCVGVWMLAARACGLTIEEPPPYSAEMPGAGMLREHISRYCDEINRSDILPGDSVVVHFLGSPRHLMVYAGNNSSGQQLFVAARARRGGSKVSYELMLRSTRIESVWRVRGMD